jgi:TRAP-type C4-dicarboxylate transport system permease small subunit
MIKLAQVTTDKVKIPAYGLTNLSDVFHKIINLLLLIVAVAAVVGIIIGGYQYITSAGNPDQASKGRTTVFASLIALVIAGSAYAAVLFIYKNILS